ncbi:MAG: hypothetical protein R3B93_17710 [Bacteroidia bacterium]
MKRNKKVISDSSRLVNSLNQQFDLAIEQQQLIEALESKFPKYYRLKYDHQIITIADLQQSLQPDEAMILLFLLVGVMLPLFDWKGTQRLSSIPI